jgi:hypothetical protein
MLSSWCLLPKSLTERVAVGEARPHAERPGSVGVHGAMVQECVLKLLYFRGTVGRVCAACGR